MHLISEEYLAHHGILGQKWGIRRFQNKDGSLTNAGKSRYQKGKQYSKEINDLSNKERQRLQKSSTKYQKAQKEAKRIQEKYGLDADDGGGGNTNAYDEETLRRARTRYWNLAEDMAALDEAFYDRGKKYAQEQIQKKYGDTAMSDIAHYERTNAYIGAVGLIGLLGAYTFAATR